VGSEPTWSQAFQCIMRSHKVNSTTVQRRVHLVILALSCYTFRLPIPHARGSKESVPVAWYRLIARETYAQPFTGRGNGIGDDSLIVSSPGWAAPRPQARSVVTYPTNGTTISGAVQGYRHSHSSQHPLYQVDYAPGPEPTGGSQWTTVAHVENVQVEKRRPGCWDTTGLPDGLYCLALTVSGQNDSLYYQQFVTYLTIQQRPGRDVYAASPPRRNRCPRPSSARRRRRPPWNSPLPPRHVPPPHPGWGGRGDRHPFHWKAGRAQHTSPDYGIALRLLHRWVDHRNAVPARGLLPAGESGCALVHARSAPTSPPRVIPCGLLTLVSGWQR